MDPITIPEILDHVFKFCRLQELSNVCRVSQQWNEVARCTVRKQAVVKIRREPPSLNWETIHQDFNYDGPRFRRFELDQIVFRNNENVPAVGCPAADPQVATNMGSFWILHGQHITELKMTMTHVYCVEAFRRAIFQQTPKLEKLNIELVMDAMTNDKSELVGNADRQLPVNLNMKQFKLTIFEALGSFPITMDFLLSRYPQLENLSIKANSNILLTSLVRYYEHREGNIPLKVFKLGDHAEVHLDALRRLLQVRNLRLRQLKLSFNSIEFEDGQNGAFAKIMQFQGEWLESLHLVTVIHSEADFPFIDRTYPALTRLILDGCLSSDFLFLLKTPNLVTLHLRDNPWIRMLNEEHMFLFGDFRLSSLKEFFFQNGTCINGDDMDRIITLMPNVERFYGYIDSAAFVSISQRWLTLTRLVVDNYYHDYLAPDVDFIGDEAISRIIALRQLETFKIMSGGRIGVPSMTAIMQLENLRTLRMEPSDNTTRAYAELQQKFPGFDNADNDRNRYKWW